MDRIGSQEKGKSRIAEFARFEATQVAPSISGGAVPSQELFRERNTNREFHIGHILVCDIDFLRKSRKWANDRRAE